MNLTIHKGTRQIGGNVVELCTRQARIMLDMGADLPNSVPRVGEEGKPFQVEGVTVGEPRCDGVFLSHYHADHTGLAEKVLPSIPIFIGKTARKIQIISTGNNRYQRHLLPMIEAFQTYTMAEPVRIKDITITPFFIDHSAFDAYMFLIEAEGTRILYTGDFRTHGFRGNKTVPMLKKFVGQVDYIICEGTLLTRWGKSAMTERELQNEAKRLMRKYKYVFVLCATTNIDRIAAFYHANREVSERRVFVCDKSQAGLLEVVRENHAAFSDFYDFRKIYTYHRGKPCEKLDGVMKDRGFCMAVRTGPWFGDFLDKYFTEYPQDTTLIYSMWDGYLDDRAENQSTVEFLSNYPYVKLHSSGHATPKDIKDVCETVSPRKGIIPIHGENPEAFRELCPDYPVILPQDGEEIVL